MKPVVTEEPHVRPVLLAIWFGFFTGIGEVLITSARSLFRNPFVGFGHDVIWMTPLTDVVLFAGAGLLLYLVNRRSPESLTVGRATFVCAFLAFSSLLLMIWSSVHVFGKLLLAMGLASVVARVAAAQPRLLSMLTGLTMGWIGFFDFRRKQAPSLERSQEPGDRHLVGRSQFLLTTGAALAGLTAGVRGWDWLREQRGLSALPSASAGLPNVLLITLDVVRAKSLSLGGYHRPTSPELERLAKTGVSFERAFSTSPWTSPSHGSMFTGRFPHELSVDWEAALDATHPTLAEVLAGHGYETAGFVANAKRCSRESGLNRGFMHYEDYLVSAGQFVESASISRFIANRQQTRDIIGNYQLLGRKNAEMLNHDFLRWLSRRDRRRPFFAFLNYYDAHDPYVAPAEFALKFSEKIPRGHLVRGERYTKQQFQELNSAYDGTIAYLDHHVGSLLSQLREQGLLEHTLVIVTGDHGEQFGEHGLSSHANSLYLPSLHVPLVIVFPTRGPADRRISEPVSLRDLPNTVMDLVGLGRATPFPGESLARYWNDGSAVNAAGSPLLAEISQGIRAEAWEPSSRGDMKALIVGSMHYIRNGDGSEELYDYEHDPAENTNLTSTADGERMLSGFRASLGALLSRV